MSFPHPLADGVPVARAALGRALSAAPDAGAESLHSKPETRNPKPETPISYKDWSDLRYFGDEIDFAERSLL